MDSQDLMRAAFSQHLKAYPYPFSISAESASTYKLDPSYWLFKFSRYKHVARMLEGCTNVLEVGCGDGLATPLVASKVQKLCAIDFLPELISYAQTNIQPIHTNIHFACHDLVIDGPALHLLGHIDSSATGFDAVFSLDVFEHIDPSQSVDFLANICNSLSHDGIAIIGMPSLESQVYASPMSKIGHVNCMSKEDLRNLLRSYFVNVFVFGINDETLHTGYGPMSHYLLALCTGLRCKAPEHLIRPFV